MSIHKEIGPGIYQSVCDVCEVETINGTRDNDGDKAHLESHGWRWRPRRSPLDTCPKCLAREDRS